MWQRVAGTAARIVLCLAMGWLFLHDATAHAQRGTTAPLRAAAHARAVAELASAASLTEAQVATVFAQLPLQVVAPTLQDVQVDVRPDGTRHIFGLLDVDRATQCLLQGSLDLPVAEIRSECRAERGFARFVLLVQVDPSGRVDRTRLHLPRRFVSQPFEQDVEVVSLRLFAPAEGEAKVALLDAQHLSPAGRGEPATFVHQVLLWDGTDVHDIAKFEVARPNHPHLVLEQLGSVALDEEHHRLVVRRAHCEDECRCSMPTSIEAEGRLLARAEQARIATCRPEQRSIAAPPGARLVDVDLDARTPSDTSGQRREQRVVDVAARAALDPAAARELVSRSLSTVTAPRFVDAHTRTLDDGAREIYLRTERSEFLECVYGSPSSRSRYDSVRACAHLDEVRTSLVYARVDGAGSLTASGSYAIVTGSELVSMRWAETDARQLGVLLVELYRAQRNGPLIVHMRHTVEALREGRPAASLGVGTTTGTAHFDVGPASIAQVLEGTRGTALHVRRTECTAQCRCATVPLTAADAVAAIEARVAAPSARCPVTDEWLDALRGW